MRAQNIIIGVLVFLLIICSFIIGFFSKDIYNEIQRERAENKEILKRQLYETFNTNPGPSTYQEVLKQRELEAQKIRNKIENLTSQIYEVKKGDTLDTISKLFGVSKEAIMIANKLAFPEITVGSTLVIPNH